MISSAGRLPFRASWLLPVAVPCYSPALCTATVGWPLNGSSPAPAGLRPHSFHRRNHRHHRHRYLDHAATFTASAHGANLSFADIQLALDAAFNVSISPGTTGTESGNVISTEAVSFNNSSAAGLTLLTGSGANQVGNVTLAGLGFSDPATNVQLNAAGNIAFTGGVNVTPTGSLAITSFGGTVNSAGGQLVSGGLTLNAKTSIGSAASPLLVNTNTLTTNTTNGLSTQFITEANGLTALDLRASSGTINLNITSGGVFDTDSSTDISATWIIVSLLDANTAISAPSPIPSPHPPSSTWRYRPHRAEETNSSTKLTPCPV